MKRPHDLTPEPRTPNAERSGLNARRWSSSFRVGFTLIELLVVVTIIVVLLALLAPGLDRAIYQAGLTACGATLDGLVSGSQTYAVGSQRRYPARHDDVSASVSEQTIYIGTTGAWYDLRAVVKGYIAPQHFMCPLSGKVSLDGTQPDTVVYGSYSYWAGWKFAGYSGMDRLGERWGWAFNGPTEQFSLVASDRDVIAYTGSQVQSTHPDSDGVLSWNVQSRDSTDNPWGAKLAIAMWYTNRTFLRGPVDRNFGYADGSVIRHDGIALDSSGWPADDRFTTVGMYNSPSSNTNGAWHDIVPREGG
jgi:prepilin-type N-terminal cleavage/methylation domain-containing protein